MKENIAGEDYTDASWVEKSGNIVIATHGPMKNTIVRFLQMITDQKIDAIVMLTKTFEMRLGYKMKKCEQYWPNVLYKPVVFGHMEIILMDQSELKAHELIERTLQIKNLNTGDEQKLVMLHYIAWPDFGVPTNSQTLYKMANSLKNYESALVHCSAGVGRTGTFIALSNLIDLVESNAQYLNLFKVVLDLRKDRPYMVETFEQYAFLYSALANYMFSRSTQAEATNVEESSCQL